MRPTAWCAQGLSGEPLDHLARRWVVLDVETTGLNPLQHVLTEVAFVELDHRGCVAHEGSWRSDDGDAELASFVQELADLFTLGAVLVAHNLRFDLAFLEADRRTARMAGCVGRWLCTLNFAGRMTLGKLAATEGVDHEAAHTALGDARTLARVLARWIARAREAQHLKVSGLVLVVRRRSARVDGEAAWGGEAGWGALRAMLPHVVPVPPLGRDARRLFRSLAQDYGRDGPASLTDLGEALKILSAANLCLIHFDRLSREFGLQVAGVAADSTPD